MEIRRETTPNTPPSRERLASGIIELAKKPSEYIPPVGPGSKSLPPTGDWRTLPPGMIPNPPRRKK